MVTFKVTSADDIRRLVQDVPWDVNPEFQVRKSTSLADAHQILGLVSAKGGHGTLLNPDLLLRKEAALEFVERKLTHLRRWKSYLDKKLSMLEEKIPLMEIVVEEGGPGVRGGFEPSSFKGDFPYLDTEQAIDDQDLEDHIAKISALLLEASPGSPAADAGYGSAEACIAREKAEQLDVTRFNLAYLEVKRAGVAMLSNHLEQGIKELEDAFVSQPTRLGAQSADFIRFQDVVTHSGEVVKKGSDW